MPTTHSYPYFSSSSLTRKNVHMPFITPFAVNNGPTYINLGSNSTFFGKHSGQDQIRVTHSDIEREEKQTMQLPERAHHHTKDTTETPYYPRRHHGYPGMQEPGITSMSLSYGNDISFQVMLQNQTNYTNYSPTLVNNSMFSNLPFATSYRNYGDNSESMSCTRLPSYPAPLNSMISFPYRTSGMESSYNQVTTKNIPENLPKFENDSLSSCSFSAAQRSTSETYSNNLADERKQCASYGKSFPCSSANLEKECQEKMKTWILFGHKDERA